MHRYVVARFTDGHVVVVGPAGWAPRPGEKVARRAVDTGADVGGSGGAARGGTGGYSDALTATADHPSYFAGFSVNIPIRNRTAQADQIRSELEYRQAQTRMQQQQNQIGIEVRNAQFALTQNGAST